MINLDEPPAEQVVSNWGSNATAITVRKITTGHSIKPQQKVKDGPV
jgi:hypothetical protein